MSISNRFPLFSPPPVPGNLIIPKSSIPEMDELIVRNLFLDFFNSEDEKEKIECARDIVCVSRVNHCASERLNQDFFKRVFDWQHPPLKDCNFTFALCSNAFPGHHWKVITLVFPFVNLQRSLNHGIDLKTCFNFNKAFLEKNSVRFFQEEQQKAENYSFMDESTQCSLPKNDKPLFDLPTPLYSKFLENINVCCEMYKASLSAEIALGKALEYTILDLPILKQLADAYEETYETEEGEIQSGITPQKMPQVWEWIDSLLHEGNRNRFMLQATSLTPEDRSIHPQEQAKKVNRLKESFRYDYVTRPEKILTDCDKFYSDKWSGFLSKSTKDSSIFNGVIFKGFPPPKDPA